MSTSAIPTFSDDSVQHRYAELDDVRLHYVEAGDGPLVVLLHGFPEFWYSWRHQIGPLVAAGYRVVAPDLRGYNRSDKPKRTDAYRVERLAGDVDQLVEAVGATDAHIVGHDWGGMVAWWTAILFPHRVRKLSVANCPHPAFQRPMMYDPAQVRRSWYMLLFQVPWLPARRFEANDFAYLETMLRTDPERADAFTSADIARYKEAFRDGAVASAMRYYRALLRRPPSAHEAMLRPIECPAQVIWGARDRHLGLAYAEPPAKWVWDLRMDYVDDASHWVQVDRPVAYNARLLDFLGEPPA
jgi:pimeloyl-ACP methyl ester carboxylesterase